MPGVISNTVQTRSPALAVDGLPARVPTGISTLLVSSVIILALVVVAIVSATARQELAEWNASRWICGPLALSWVLILVS